MADEIRYFTIEETAEIFGVSISIIYRIVDEGLVQPRPEAEDNRLFSSEELERIRTILALSRELGVNWAGVEVILHMRERMLQLQEQVFKIFDHLNEQVRQELETREASSPEPPEVTILKIIPADDSDAAED